MIEIGSTLVSENIFDKKFVCNLTKCKGMCCVEGESGAPLNSDEIMQISNNYEKIKPFLSKEGKDEIDKKNFYETDSDGDLVTTCRETGECNFAIYENETAYCGIEKAYKAGESDFLKPISCHLYPIRLSKVGNYTALNYHEWALCKPACSFGEELNIPVFTFLKDSITRKFGAEYYNELVEINTQYTAYKNSK